MTFSQELDRLSLHFVKITLQIRKLQGADRFALWRCANRNERANVAWNAAMMRPDRFKAAFCLAVPYSPPRQSQCAGCDEGGRPRERFLHVRADPAAERYGSADPEALAFGGSDLVSRSRDSALRAFCCVVSRQRARTSLRPSAAMPSSSASTFRWLSGQPSAVPGRWE
jgi:hypothetical protein